MTYTVARHQARRLAKQNSNVAFSRTKGATMNIYPNTLDPNTLPTYINSNNPPPPYIQVIKPNSRIQAQCLQY